MGMLQQAHWGRSKDSSLSWIKDAVINKIAGWKEKLLNQVGREDLIKSVIQAILSYAMPVLRFSKGFCERLCSKLARFWWSKNSTDRGIIAETGT